MVHNRVGGGGMATGCDAARQAESRLRTQRVMVDAGFPHAGPSVVE